ncbi:MAG: tetratricopeptide repeat protein [Aureispira sp.]
MKIAFYCSFFFLSLLAHTHAQIPDSLQHYSITQLDSVFQLRYKNKQYDQIMPYALAASNRAKQQYGEQDTLYARMLYQLGLAFDYQDDFEQGIAYYERATKIQASIIPFSPDFANTLFAIANIYHYNLRKYNKALPFYIQAKNIRKKAFGTNHPLFAASLNNLAGLHSKMGNYELALPLYIQAKNIYEKAFGTAHTDFATSMNNLAGLYLRMGKYKLALPLFIQAKNIYEQVLGKDHPSLAASLNNLAGLHKFMGNYEQALPLFIQAKNIREKALGTDHLDFAASLNNLALLHQAMGNYELALPLYIQAKTTKEKALGKEHPDLASSLHNLAALYQDMGNYELALLLFIQAKNSREKTLGKNHPRLASSFNDIATLYQTTGNYELALPLFIQAKNIKEKALGKNHPSFATALNNLASLHQAMESYERALPLLNQAKDIIEKNLGKDHPSFATALNNLATLHQAMENHEQALPLFIQAKDIIEKTLGKDHSNFATALYNLAKLHQSMEHYEQALPLLNQAKLIYEKAFGKDHPYFAKALNNLAKLHEQKGNYPKAWNLLEQAINNMARLNVELTFDRVWKDSLMNATYLSNLHIDQLLDALEIAYRLLEKDYSIKMPAIQQKNIADLALILLNKERHKTSNEKDKLRLLSRSNNWMQKSLRILNPEQEMNKAFNLADQNKSVLLLQATQSEVAYQLGELPDSLVFKDKKLLKKQSQTQAKLLEPRSKKEKDSLRNELNHIYQNIGEFEKMTEQYFPKYHKLKYAQVDAQVNDIQALLDDNTALLEYVIADSVVHIFLVDKKEVQWKKFFIKNKILKRKIRALRLALSQYELLIENPEKAYNNYTGKAHWFYQNLVLPVLKDKAAIHNLIIVTDGELGHLPFESFLMQAAPQSITDYHELHYLVNHYNISYNYSATLWKENKEAITPQNNGQILAMAANYKLQVDSSLLNIRLPTDQWTRGDLSPLPAARKEVETLQERYQGFFAFDRLASEKTVKEKASDYAVLHFATHGILEKHRPVLSSLAFSEDNDSTESNFWQAHEISKMQLHANLVVLSACETGYGKFEQGNGIASLARAFMYAGASALIVSLWQVDDYATSKIMENLYANLADGMKKDEALRQAKIQYMQQSEGILAHPALWSSFIMMGNTAPVHIKKKGNPLAWGIGIGALALLALGGLVHRKKAG